MFPAVKCIVQIFYPALNSILTKIFLIFCTFCILYKSQIRPRQDTLLNNRNSLKKLLTPEEIYSLKVEIFYFQKCFFLKSFHYVPVGQSPLNFAILMVLFEG